MLAKAAHIPRSVNFPEAAAYGNAYPATALPPARKAYGEDGDPMEAVDWTVATSR